jgi:hypothetical protein
MDEVMNVANILMDGMVYVDRRSFMILVACLNPLTKIMLFKDKFITPEYFPFAEVMSSILFNRHLNNYKVKCFYNSNKGTKSCRGELLTDMTKIINDNIDVFKPILKHGSVIVEFSYYFTKVKFPQVHFVVIR